MQGEKASAKGSSSNIYGFSGTTKPVGGQKSSAGYSSGKSPKSPNPSSEGSFP